MSITAGRLAFVTGAGSGIGRAVCKVLAREGANVVATDQNIKTAEETIQNLEGGEHLALEVQVTDPINIELAFKKVIKHFSKPPTIIVNSAGITRDNFILKLDSKDFEDVINVNLKGTFLVMQSAVKAVIDAGVSQDTAIINIGSIIGKLGNIGQGNYSASKAGVEALTKTASMEFGKFGVRINTVLPGFIETPMTSTVPDNVKQMFINRVALRRLGKPEEIAEVVAFLASKKSSYINGTSIEVTGGMH